MNVLFWEMPKKIRGIDGSNLYSILSSQPRFFKLENLFTNQVGLTYLITVKSLQFGSQEWFMNLEGPPDPL